MHYIIADGERAIIYKNASGSVSNPDFKRVEEMTPTSLDNDGPAGKQPPETSLQDKNEATFAKQLGLSINKKVLAGEIAKFVLVADPITLGQLRAVLDHGAMEKLHTEHAKTLTNSGFEEIYRSLFA